MFFIPIRLFKSQVKTELLKKAYKGESLRKPVIIQVGELLKLQRKAKREQATEPCLQTSNFCQVFLFHELINVDKESLNKHLSTN